MSIDSAQEKPLSVPVSVRFSAAEMEQLREQAERAGIPLSTFVRKNALVRPISPGRYTLTPSNVAPLSDVTVGSPKVDMYRGSFSVKVG